MYLVLIPVKAQVGITSPLVVKVGDIASRKIPAIFAPYGKLPDDRSAMT